jgi:hypothetical protein
MGRGGWVKKKAEPSFQRGRKLRRSWQQAKGTVIHCARATEDPILFDSAPSSFGIIFSCLDSSTSLLITPL